MQASRAKSASVTGLSFGSRKRSAVQAIAAGVAAALLSLTALAQVAPVSPNATSPEMQEVVITGSMIKRVNAETAEAVTTVKMDALKDQGVSSVEEALALLTSNNATITTASNVATFNGGASVASLRGLGPTKTLVLLDAATSLPITRTPVASTPHYHDFAPDAAGNLLTVGNYSIWNGYVTFKPVPALKLLAGINNLFDTDPPFSNQERNWQAGYNPVFSSPVGRAFYGRITYDL